MQEVNSTKTINPHIFAVIQ